MPAYIFRIRTGACDLLEFASEAMALVHADLNPHRYASVWDRDGRCIWRAMDDVRAAPLFCAPLAALLRRDH